MDHPTFPPEGHHYSISHVRIPAVPCKARGERATLPTAHGTARTSRLNGCAARSAGKSSPSAEVP